MVEMIDEIPEGISPYDTYLWACDYLERHHTSAEPTQPTQRHIEKKQIRIRQNHPPFSDEPFSDEVRIELIKIISERIKYNGENGAGGFDMSGYGNAHYHNMGIMSLVKDYITPRMIKDEYRNSSFLFPIYWKGNGIICRINNNAFEVDEQLEVVENSIGGQGTPEIIAKIIEYNNPALLENIILDLEKAKKEEAEVIKTFSDKELEDFKDVKNMSTLIKTIKIFKRNKQITNQLKELYSNKCQICGFTFKKDNGENYSETHHLAELGSGGIDNIKNVIVVCPNCHKKLHYAKKVKYEILYKKEHINLLVKI